MISNVTTFLSVDPSEWNKKVTNGTCWSRLTWAHALGRIFLQHRLTASWSSALDCGWNAAVNTYSN